MKTKFSLVFAAITVLITISAPTYAQLDGQWRLDTVVPVGKDPRLPSNAVPGTDVKGWWWMPITNENLLIQHMNDEYFLTSTVPEQPVDDLWVLPLVPNGIPIQPLAVDTSGSAGGRPLPVATARFGLALFETANSVVVVGSAESGQANAVKLWVKENIGKPIGFVIIPDVYEGAWSDWFDPQESLTIIESSALGEALKARQAVAPHQFNPPSSTAERIINIKGFRLPADTDWRLNGFSLDQFGACNVPNASLPTNVNCVVIKGEGLTLTLDGLVFRFINVLDEIGGLVTYVPAMKTLIAPTLFDGHLPNTAPLQWPVIPIRKVIAAVELMMTLDIDCYFPLRDFALVGELEDGRSTGEAYLDATWAVLSSINNATVLGLREGKSLDEIVSEATIPAWVQDQCDVLEFQPASPCGEFGNSLASIVKGVYSEYMGWFDGTARSLSAHVTSADKASLFLEVANDVDGLVLVAKKMTAAADDLASIERTLYLVEPLHELALSPEIDEMYFQLLWKAGMLQTANDLRNYYLSMAWSHKPY